MRKFFIYFPIATTVSSQLSWSHYLELLKLDEEAKRIKLSYKQIHKTRGVKCRVPQFKIGFETVRQILPTWIERELKNEKNK